MPASGRSGVDGWLTGSEDAAGLVRAALGRVGAALLGAVRPAEADTEADRLAEADGLVGPA
jgi:hypothetical protein